MFWALPWGFTSCCFSSLLSKTPVLLRFCCFGPAALYHGACNMYDGYTAGLHRLCGTAITRLLIPHHYKFLGHPEPSQPLFVFYRLVSCTFALLLHPALWFLLDFFPLFSVVSLTAHSAPRWSRSACASSVPFCSGSCCFSPRRNGLVPPARRVSVFLLLLLISQRREVLFRPAFKSVVLRSVLVIALVLRCGTSWGGLLVRQ